MKRPWNFLFVMGAVLTLPGFFGATGRMAVDAYEGGSLELSWIGVALYLSAWGWSSMAKRRAREVCRTYEGTVQAISVDDLGDGRDAHIVKDASGADLFQVWAKGGTYAMGERLAMRQWVERRPGK